MTYTHLLPTKPGWYWRRQPDWLTGQAEEVVQVREYAGELAVGNSSIRAHSDVTWAGPITTPDRPRQEVVHELLEDIRQTNASEFEAVLKACFDVCSAASENSPDPAWADAACFLVDAKKAVHNRLGD